MKKVDMKRRTFLKSVGAGLGVLLGAGLKTSVKPNKLVEKKTSGILCHDGVIQAGTIKTESKTVIHKGSFKPLQDVVVSIAVAPGVKTNRGDLLFLTDKGKVTNRIPLGEVIDFSGHYGVARGKVKKGYVECII